MEAKFWIPIGISIVALFVTAISVWHAWLSPFKPHFNAGTPLLALSPDEEGKNFSLTPIIPVSITNTGARGGTIKDINIVVTAGGSTWVLVPYFFCSEFSVAGVKEEFREVFHPIYIGGKEEIYKNILFNPVIREPQLLPPIFTRNEGGLPSGKYTLQFYISYGSSSEFRFIQQMTFELTEKQANDISRGAAVLIPLDTEGILARDKLREGLLQ